MVMVVIIVLVQVVMNDDDTHLPVRRMEEAYKASTQTCHCRGSQKPTGG